METGISYRAPNLVECFAHVSLSRNVNAATATPCSFSTWHHSDISRNLGRADKAWCTPAEYLRTFQHRMSITCSCCVLSSACVVRSWLACWYSATCSPALASSPSVTARALHTIRLCLLQTYVTLVCTMQCISCDYWVRTHAKASACAKSMLCSLCCQQSCDRYLC